MESQDFYTPVPHRESSHHLQKPESWIRELGPEADLLSPQFLLLHLPVFAQDDSWASQDRAAGMLHPLSEYPILQLILRGFFPSRRPQLTLSLLPVRLSDTRDGWPADLVGGSSHRHLRKSPLLRPASVPPAAQTAH